MSEDQILELIARHVTWSSGRSFTMGAPNGSILPSARHTTA